jgi:hypothetical protein
MPGACDRFELVLGSLTADELRFLAQGDWVLAFTEKLACAGPGASGCGQRDLRIAPSARRSSFGPYRYLSLRYLALLGVTSRYMPMPSG